MGLEIDRVEFAGGDYARFAERLRHGLVALGELLQRPGFGIGERTIGAEVELCLVDRRGHPLPLNRAVLAEALDPGLALELDRFNLEYNTRQMALAGCPFAALGGEIVRALAEVERGAARHGGRVVTIGILPTLRRQHLQSTAMSDVKRFRALSAGVRRLRGGPFEVAIDGEDPLAVSCDDVTLEGANTSLQLHMRVAPGEFARTYNAAQIAVAPVLAAAGNSPLFLGHRLWEETRVALFGQAVDERAPGLDWRPARVSFGHGWVREGALELFSDSVAVHAPLLPIAGSEDALGCVRRGGVPALDELRLHQGTVWHWNRAVYDGREGGHLRIEMRALPAGPSTIDMVANCAFLLGLTLGLVPLVDRVVPAMPFRHAHDNFYRAARFGLDARIYWPSEYPSSPCPVRADELIPRLLPVAREGLLAAGVDESEIDYLLGLLEERVARGVTGARWQRRVLAEYERRLSRREALAAMLGRYVEHSNSGRPVHYWPES